MQAAPSDMHIIARWIAPMTGDCEPLEHHTLVVRDGRIVAVLPNAAAAERYVPRVSLSRATHLLMPGLIDAHTRIGSSARGGIEDFRPDLGLLGIANMIKSGITAFCDVGYFPSDVARTAQAQGLRALIGLPLAARPSPWAQSPGEYSSRALRLRDEYKGHPSLSTAFAPMATGELDDSTLARMGTLAAELDAGILVSLHASQRDIDDSLTRYGKRPLARLEALGLLTPALTASHAVHLDAAEIELARRSGIGMVLCLASSLRRGNGLPPIATLTSPRSTAPGDAAESDIRLGLGCDGEFCGSAEDLWTEIKLLALHARHPARPADMLTASASAADASEADTPAADVTAAAVLAAATRGGAAALGLDAHVGTLEAGKWADLCCVDLAGPALQPIDDPLDQLVFAGGRDLVSDVWVAGRQLLCEGQFTRLDWPALAGRLRIEPHGDTA